jgi:putative glutamine amidotransferase
MRTNSNSRPLVGINTDLRIPAKGRAPVSVVATGYVDCVLGAGGIPIIIPPLTKEQDLRPMVDRLDALIFIGGDDLDPKRLGMAPHPAVRIALPRREDSDRLLVRMATDRKLPILGIGLGMQLLNVMFGGTIYQHLPEDLPRALPHKDPLGGSHRHGIEITPGTRLDDIYGDGEIRVNSSHHQAVRRVSNKFRVAAVAPDGVIEAIEAIDPNWFCMGVQWNPASETASALDLQLFEAMIASCGALALAA